MPSPEIEALIAQAHAHHLKRGGKSYAASPLSKRAGPCVRFGEDTGKTRTCPTCSGKVELKVFGCSLHGECTPTLPVDGVKCCTKCDDHLAAGVHPNILAADEFARNIPPYPEGKYSGRGVVIVGGGKYWPSTYVTVKMLRHVGCTLPIQVWHLGAAERDDRYKVLLAPLGVEVIDALAHPEAANTRNLTGFPGQPPFQAKSFAVLHSPFEEVLSLDADCYPCADPTEIFSEARYRHTGAVFWPDLANTNGWTKWHDYGVPPFRAELPWEAGQYVLNKRKAWGPLLLTRWYDDHGDWCYGGTIHHGHGDKDCHRVAWAKFRREPTFYAAKATWKNVAFLQPGPNGVEPMFIHRCRSKFSLVPTPFSNTPQNGTNLRGDLPLEREAFGYLEELARSL